jgi:hypothetical protein
MFLYLLFYSLISVLGKSKKIFIEKFKLFSGEFFASPAIALADSAVITSLGDQQVTEKSN